MNTTTRFLVAIQGLILSGAWMLEYLSGRYMGIMRSVLYRNRLWESVWPMESITFIAACFLLLIAAGSAGMTLAPFIRHRHIRPESWASPLVLTLMASGTAGFILLRSTDSVRTYYIVILLLLLATAVQGFLALRSLERRSKGR